MLGRMWWLALLLIAAAPLLWARWPQGAPPAHSSANTRPLSPERLIERWWSEPAPATRALGTRSEGGQVASPDASVPASEAPIRVLSVRAGDAARAAILHYQQQGLHLQQQLDAHSGEALGAPRPVPPRITLSRGFAAALGGAAWLLLALPWLRKRQGLRRGISASNPTTASSELWWVVHASQSGQAQRLAEQTVARLHARGCDARLLSIAQVDAPGLSAARRLLLVASTTGEGDPPDTAAAFVRRVMAQTLDLDGLRFGLLALGDRSYRDYCAFGRALDAWLLACSAKPLFERVEVDDGDSKAIAAWLQAVESAAADAPVTEGGVAIAAVSSAAAPAVNDSNVVELRLAQAAPTSEQRESKLWQPWVLHARSCLNPDSASPALCDLELLPASAPLPSWLPGDVAVLQPQNCAESITQWIDARGLDAEAEVRIDGQSVSLWEALRERALENLAGWEPAQKRASVSGQSLTAARVESDPLGWIARLPKLPTREYSIASTAASGRVRLIVRRQNHPDGRPGLGSGTLLDSPLGTRLTLRLRSNSGFRPPSDDQPLILIGAGSGIAGLLGLLQARIERSAGPNWLLFGERHPQQDCVLDAELQAYLDSGALQRLDRSFSRDPAAPAYVQHQLHQHAGCLRDWLGRGAHLRVCGSRRGIGKGVQAALVALLGQCAVDVLVAEGRYRRDVY